MLRLVEIFAEIITSPLPTLSCVGVCMGQFCTHCVPFDPYSRSDESSPSDHYYARDCNYLCAFSTWRVFVWSHPPRFDSNNQRRHSDFQIHYWPDNCRLTWSYTESLPGVYCRDLLTINDALSFKIYSTAIYYCVKLFLNLTH